MGIAKVTVLETIFVVGTKPVDTVQLETHGKNIPIAPENDYVPLYVLDVSVPMLNF